MLGVLLFYLFSRRSTFENAFTAGGPGEELKFGTQEQEEGKVGDLTQNKKVALYLTGQARTLNRTWCSILENIVQPLIDSKTYEKIVVFVVAERDPRTHTFEDSMRFIQNRTKHIVTSEIVSIPRPLVVAKPSKYENAEIPYACYERLANRGRWFHGGGEGMNSKNGIYTAELLSQLYYRRRVNELRIKYEKKNEFEFDWIILARPDNVYIDELPHPESLIRRNKKYDHKQHNTIYSVNWGLGNNKNSWSRAKHATGINDRFALSDPSGMNILMGMYDGLCAKETQIPTRMNLEQLTYWYLKEVHNLNVVFLPNRFLFYRLRMNSRWPLEHPGHKPPLVPKENRLERLQSYKKAIGFIQRCQQESLYEESRSFHREDRENYCMWNVSELFFRYTNVFLLPTAWLHRLLCF